MLVKPSGRSKTSWETAAVRIGIGAIVRLGPVQWVHFRSPGGPCPCELSAEAERRLRLQTIAAASMTVTVLKAFAVHALRLHI